MIELQGYVLRPTLKVVALLTCLMLLACSSPEEKAQAHLERGKELMEQKEYVKAGLEFRNAIKFNDKLLQAWIALSQVEEFNQNLAALESTLTRVLELDPKQTDALVRMAKLQLIVGNIEKALGHINEASSLKPDDSDVLATKAATLLRLNDREGARLAAERALAFNRDNTDAMAVLAADRIADTDFKNAQLYTTLGLTIDEKNLPLLLLNVRIAEQSNDEKQLETVMRQLLSFYPEKLAFRRALIVMLLRQERLEEALSELRELAAAQPEKASAALEVVEFLRRSQGAEAARAELVSLAKAHPMRVDYKLALAEFDYGQDRIAPAKKALLDIIEQEGAPSDDVRRAQLLLIRFHLRQKETQQAAALIANVLSSDEKNADALGLRASIRLDANEIDAAIGDLREALNQNPESVPLLRLLGQALERRGAVELAQERYKQALTLSNYVPDMALHYVSFLMKRGNIEDAEGVLVKSIERHPSNRALLRSLARLRLDRQDWIGAEAIAGTLKSLGDVGAVSDQILGTVRYGQERFDESIATFKSAFVQSQGAVRPMLALTTAYVRAGKLEEAEAFVNSVLEANQNNAEAYVILGSLLVVQNKDQAAETAYKTAVERQSDNPVGYLALARHYMASGQVQLALETLRSGRTSLPKDFGLGMRLAATLELAQDYEGAISVYDQLLALQPESLVVSNNLASLLVEHRTDAASLEKAHNISRKLQNNDLPQFKDTLGWVSFRQGEFRTALSYLQAAVQQRPESAHVRYHLALTYEALGQRSEALRELNEGLALTKKESLLRTKIQDALRSVQDSGDVDQDNANVD